MIIALLLSRALHFHVMLPCRQRACVVGGVTVRLDRGIRLDRFVGDMLDAVLVVAWRMGQAQPPALFGGHQNRGFIALLAADKGFVNLHRALQTVAIFANHRTANAMRPGPGGLIRAEPQNTLQISRRDAMAVHADLPYRPEPKPQWLARAVKQRARRQARLMAT